MKYIMKHEDTEKSYNEKQSSIGKKCIEKCTTLKTLKQNDIPE